MSEETNKTNDTGTITDSHEAKEFEKPYLDIVSTQIWLAIHMETVSSNHSRAHEGM